MKKLLTIVLAVGMTLALVSAADFNGDGFQDLIIFNKTTRHTRIDYLHNTTLIGWHAGPGLPAGVDFVDTGDFNHDGHQDIMVWNPTTRWTTIWYMNGPNVISVHGSVGFLAGWRPLFVADMNNDGHPDVIYAKEQTRALRVVFMTGYNTTGADYALPTLPVGWLLKGVADVNHDGHKDLIFFNPSTRQSVVWYLGAPIPSGSPMGPLLPGTEKLRHMIGFANETATPTIESGVEASVIEMPQINQNGNIAKIGQAALPTAPAGWGLSLVADFNHDGRADLWIATPAGHTSSFLLNVNQLIGNLAGPVLPLGWSTLQDAGKTAFFTLNPTQVLKGAAGGSGQFLVGTNFGVAWHCVSTVPWITVTNAVTYGSGGRFYTVAANPGASRSGHINIVGPNGMTFYFTVNQQAATQSGISGTWSGTISGTWSAAGCSWVGTASFGMTVTGGASFTGTSYLNGDPCFDDNTCGINDFPNASGSVNGTVSGTTVTINFNDEVGSGACSGQTVSGTINGTLSGTTINGTNGNRTVILHKN